MSKPDSRRYKEIMRTNRGYYRESKCVFLFDEDEFDKFRNYAGHVAHFAAHGFSWSWGTGR